MKIIAIFGKKEAGKSTLAKLIKEEIESLSDNVFVVRISFSDELKKMLLEAEICTYEELHEKKTKFSRFMLQKIGTEIVRKVDPDYWCKRVFKKIENEYNIEEIHGEIEKIIILDDVRFPNEYKMLASMNAYLLRICNFKADSKKDDHVSETNIDNFNCHFWVNNDGTIEELRQVARMLSRNVLTFVSLCKFPGFTDYNSNSWRTKE